MHINLRYILTKYTKIFKCYIANIIIDKLDVYDNENLIDWNIENEIYVTAKEGEMPTRIVKKT